MHPVTGQTHPQAISKLCLRIFRDRSKIANGEGSAPALPQEGTNAMALATSSIHDYADARVESARLMRELAFGDSPARETAQRASAALATVTAFTTRRRRRSALRA